jgi:hypothetical protein
VRRFLICSAVAVILICLIVFSGMYFRHNAAEEMLANFNAVLKDYPSLPASFVSNICFLEKDGMQYLWMEMKDRRVTGRRLPDGRTEYCFDGMTYLETDGVLTPSETDLADIFGVIHTCVTGFLQDPQTTYTYHKATGLPLPMWIYPEDDAYLLVKREGYEGYMETMLYANEDGEEVRWCFLSSEEDVLLYLSAVESRLKNLDYIRGWGEVPQEAVDFLKDTRGITDAELYEIVLSKIMEMTAGYGEEAEILENLSPAYRTFYIIASYDMEMQCGGLCQFFVNPSRDLAPYVEEALETVSAQDHWELYSDFITDNKINVWDLKSFEIQSIRQYAEQFARYDFGGFDDAYYELQPLYNDLIQWVREHIDEFALE